LSVVPGLSKIAKGAPREGTFNPKAEAKAFAQFVIFIVLRSQYYFISHLYFLCID
jgi:hypothetical protein